MKGLLQIVLRLFPSSATTDIGVQDSLKNKDFQ